MFTVGAGIDATLAAATEAAALPCLLCLANRARLLAQDAVTA
jgi:hypothetical protein